MKYRVSFHVELADDETGVQVKDVKVVPYRSEPDPAYR